MSDEELVKKVKNGDVDAFEQIITKYEKKIFGLIYNMLRNENEVEDVAQEVFIKVYKNLDKFHGDSSLYTWIYKIATNLCLDQIKKRKEVIYIDEKLQLDDGEVDFQLPSDEKLQDEIYEQKELKQKLEKCIDKLPERQKTMIVLRDIKGLSYDEIAEILDLKLGTVKSQINRARLKLKELLEKDGTFVEYIESK
ncbi:MAG: sigma-70 family RNA polymerase sigma factor [Clostridia bacterium]|nr:sigma-70 family RNA polymerase sigma factor [Clostridia bacterium]